MHGEISLKGKQALVCGASAGIGRAAALALAAHGADVTVLARSADKLQALLPTLTGEGAGTARALAADLDDRAGLEQQVRAHLAAHGPVHILVNNASGPPPGPLLDARPDDFLQAFGRHLLAPQLLVQLLVPGMKQAGYGRIVNVISTSVREPIPNLGVSNTIRAAVAGWAKTLSRELPPGLTINSVLPGYVDTNRLGALADSLAQKQGKTADEVRQTWLAGVPEGRLGKPKELGAVIAFLASPAAAFIRGVVLPVDGGRLNGI